MPLLLLVVRAEMATISCISNGYMLQHVMEIGDKMYRTQNCFSSYGSAKKAS